VTVDRFGGVTSPITWKQRFQLIVGIFQDPLASERETLERAGYKTVKEDSLSTTVSQQTSTRTSGPDILDDAAALFWDNTIVSSVMGEDFIRNMMGDDYLMNTSGAGLVTLTISASVVIGITTVWSGPCAGCSIASTAGNAMVLAAFQWAGTTGMAKLINPVDGKATFTDFVTTVGSAGLFGGALGGIGKAFGLTGCFVAETKVSVSALPGECDSDSMPLSECAAGFENELASSLLCLTTASRTSTQVAIQNVPLGARIATKNPKPWEYDDSLPEPDELAWAKISFVVRRDDGTIVDTELLRPWSWVESQSILPGQSITVHMPELEIHGIATVTGLEPCPPLADGDGEFVTGRFITRQVASTTRIALEGGSVIEGTPIHPIWSFDRSDWVPLGELTVGEQLLGADGPVRIMATDVVNKTTQVYNLEIRGEHVYQIGDLEVLVHNVCNSTILGRNLAGGFSWFAQKMRSDGYAAGHIVPARGFRRWFGTPLYNPAVTAACDAARKTLARVGIDINSRLNGFWTNSARHLGSHTDKYLLEMGRRLQGLTDVGEVLKQLDTLKAMLFAGKF
jgi:hypothetical protein